jgi:phage tail-like protein
MAQTPAQASDLVDAGYFDLQLKGLEKLSFMSVSGLTHMVSIGGGEVNSKDGGVEDARVIGPPEPLTLSMQYTIATEMDLWTWLDASIAAGSNDKTKKEGTLMLKSLEDDSVQMTWNLSDVYLESISVGALGAQNTSYLNADITVRVGVCKPM